MPSWISEMLRTSDSCVRPVPLHAERNYLRWLSCDCPPCMCGVQIWVAGSYFVTVSQVFRSKGTFSAPDPYLDARSLVLELNVHVLTDRTIGAF